MSEKPNTSAFRGWRRNMVFVFVGLFLFLILFPAETNPGQPGVARRGAYSGFAKNIGECLSKYAADHNGHYPEGKTSTEVFQQLIDGKYVDDPSIFYAGYGHMEKQIPGKTPPINNQLQPENVCWDVTCCVDSTSPGNIPVVFLTGYKVTYQAQAPAVPVLPTPHRTWSEWWKGDLPPTPFIAVCDKTNNALAMRPSGDGSIPNFIPANFDPKGKTYRQLTP